MQRRGLGSLFLGLERAPGGDAVGQEKRPVQVLPELVAKDTETA